MTMSFNVKALGAFWKLGAVALITATIFFVACKQTSGGGGGGKQGAPFVEGGASLILSPDNLTIKVKATTADGFAITVEGCTETTLTSDVETELHAKGTSVVLKGKITMLNCQGNQLTSLNVQGLPALKGLGCWSNQLNAQAMTELLKGLPAREKGDKAEAVLYTEEKDYTEGNCTDFTQPAELKTALEGAKSRKWMLKKFTADEGGVDF